MRQVLIVSGNYRQAQMLAQDAGLAPGAWLFICDLERVRGLNLPADVRVLVTDNLPADYSDIHHYIAAVRGRA